MKKSIISALTTALVVGAASTTFAAANPFQDVPADHWAYDAVAQLAADGVIEGYGDGTYRGDQEITRYEMAQMVARAMAKGASGADKALIDKLAAEFADELNNLGVRVSALEKKVDNMKWKGWVGYEYYSFNNRKASLGGVNGKRETYQRYRLNFDPVMTINKNWIARARIKYQDATNAHTGANIGNTIVDRAWVQGNYNNLTIKLGRIPVTTSYEGHTGGMIFDNRLSGAVVTFGKQIKATLGAGRMTDFDGQNSQTMQFIELGGDFNDKFGAGIGFYRTGKNSYYNATVANGGYRRAWDGTGANDKAFGSNWRNIWKIGLNYKFTPQWMLGAAYARSNGSWESKFKQAYSIELSYNGGRYTNSAKKGSLGAFLAYRYLGAGAVISPTYDGMFYTSESVKGIEVGVSYTFFKNVMGTLLYFNGRDIGVQENKKAQQVYGAMQFFF